MAGVKGTERSKEERREGEVGRTERKNRGNKRECVRERRKGWRERR